MAQDILVVFLGIVLWKVLLQKLQIYRVGKHFSKWHADRER